jgi:predicted transcriptional regulator
MSVDLRDAILESTLPADEKFLALVLIKFAKPDGSSIFPSQALIAELMSRKPRSIRDGLNKLKAKGVIEPVSGMGGGSAPVHYQFHVERLPTPAVDDTTPALHDSDPGITRQ